MGKNVFLLIRIKGPFSPQDRAKNVVRLGDFGRRSMIELEAIRKRFHDVINDMRENTTVAVAPVPEHTSCHTKLTGERPNCGNRLIVGMRRKTTDITDSFHHMTHDYQKK